MKLVPRSNGVWMLEYYEGAKRVRISTGERMRDKAETVARAILAGQHERAQTWTLEDALRDCYDRIWSKQKSAENTRARINRIIKLAGSTRVAEVTYDWLVEFGITLEKAGAEAATINRALSAISKALSEANMRGKAPARPKIPYRKEPKGKLRWLTRDEELTLLNECANLWREPEARAMRNLLVFLLDTGARLSEALRAGAHPGAPIVDGRAQVTFAETKNDKSRSVPLTQRAWAALGNLPKWPAKTAVDRFTKLRNHCRMPDVSLHTMRHTCASRLVQGGMDLYRVMAWLGHSSITVTQRYAHRAPTSLDAGAAILAGTAVAQGGDWTPIGGDSNRPKPGVPSLKLVK
jgi:integrase